MTTFDVLHARIAGLERDNALLRAEVEYLKVHPTIAAGMRGERLVLERVGGRLTSYAAEHDLELPNGCKIEIKYSALHSHNSKAPNTLRWTWNKVLGFRDKGKDYDFLVLIGEKDMRHADQYKGSAPFVYFFIPRDRVGEIISHGRLVGANTNLTTNFRTLRSAKCKVIVEHMVDPALIHELEGLSDFRT